MKWIANAFWLLAFAQWLWYTEWFSMVYEARERDVVVVFIVVVVVVFLLPDSSDSFCFISQIKAFLYKRQNLYETLMHTVCVSGRMFVYREWRQKKNSIGTLCISHSARMCAVQIQASNRTLYAEPLSFHMHSPTTTTNSIMNSCCSSHPKEKNY